MLKIRDLDLLETIDILYNNEIIIYGAGDYGSQAMKLLQEAGISIYGCCDSCERKWGERVGKYKIMSPKELSKLSNSGSSLILIIAIYNADSVKQVLKMLPSYEITDIACYTFFALKYTIELHINDERIREVCRRRLKTLKMIHHEEEIKHQEVQALSAVKNLLLYDNVLMIFQAGKVGSMSVHYSLQQKNINCLHIHSIIGGWGNEWGRDYQCSKTILNTMDFLRTLGKIKIISLVRDPIGREIALYFEWFKEAIFSKWVKADTLKAVNEMLEKLSQMGEYGFTFEWFTYEIEKFFGIDVFQYDFDRERGWQIIKENNIELLLIKTEKLNACQSIIGDFADIKDFSLQNTNVGSDKLYHFAYDELKKTIQIPEHIVDFYYRHNKAMDHFYTQDEKANFIKKWCKSRK